MYVSGSAAAQRSKVTQDLHFLMDCFREVLEDAGEDDLARRLPWQDIPAQDDDMVLSDRVSTAEHG
jgi:hypothetical protein